MIFVKDSYNKEHIKLVFSSVTPFSYLTKIMTQIHVFSEVTYNSFSKKRFSSAVRL